MKPDDRIGVRRVEANRGCEVLVGTLRASQIKSSHATIEVHRFIEGIEPDRQVKVWDCTIVFALDQIRVRPITESHCIVWIEQDRGIKVGDRAIRIASRNLKNAAVEVSGLEVRLVSDRSVKISQCLLDLTQLIVDIRTTIIRISVVGSEVDRLAVILDCTDVIVFIGVNVGTVVEGKKREFLVACCRCEVG